MRNTGNNTYSTSTGERLKKSVIDQRIRKAKETKIEQMKDRNEGKAELAYDVNNITIRCRECHRKHDGLNLEFSKNEK